jgi:phospholipid/cholesterol/gamma-HCH transport system substrate-binding protein
MTAPLNDFRTPPYKLAGLVLVLIAVVVVALVYMQFHGDFIPRTQLTMLADRAGLSMNTRGKVTYNGVVIGRVADIEEVTVDGIPKAKFTLDVDPKYIKLIPANVDAHVKATTVFGNKYVSLTSPKNPVSQRISGKDVIALQGVTTEFNTLFETLASIAEKVDPVKVNLTLSAAAQALSGLGEKFGASLINGDEILDELNPRMPQARYDIQRLGALGEVYANASPDLWDALDHVVTTARTVNRQQGDLDAALLAAAGLGNTGADVFGRGGPSLVRGAADSVTSSQLLDEYSPEIFCTVRNYHDFQAASSTIYGGNGYSVRADDEFIGGVNPYVYPDNLPRVNARGGPGGKPGCWQKPNRDLWPAPYLVMDTGASIAPYNHFELGQPLINEYVWGRQFGENTINP